MSGIIATCWSALAISRSLLCFTAYQMHGRHETKDSGVSKWEGADVSGVGVCFLMPQIQILLIIVCNLNYICFYYFLPGD